MGKEQKLRGVDRLGYCRTTDVRADSQLPGISSLYKCRRSVESAVLVCVTDTPLCDGPARQRNVWQDEVYPTEFKTEWVSLSPSEEICREGEIRTLQSIRQIMKCGPSWIGGDRDWPSGICDQEHQSNAPTCSASLLFSDIIKNVGSTEDSPSDISGFASLPFKTPLMQLRRCIEA